MNTRWSVAAVVGAAMALAAGIAVAQGMGQGMGPGQGAGRMGQGMQRGAGMFQMLDTNGDGAISRDEFINAPRGGPGSMMDIAKDHRAVRFAQMDVNHDGKLTPDELPGMAGATPPSK